MKQAFFISNLVFLLAACEQASLSKSGGGISQSAVRQSAVNRSAVNQSADSTARTIFTRFTPPAGFVREVASANSFAAYLQNLPLKPAGAPVLLFNGEKKARQDIHAAVIDLDVGSENLQQCADAIMRLRAEHLFRQGRFDEIHFNFTNGFHAEYAKWRAGWRISVTGNRSEWRRSAQPSESYESFREYLKLVFTYAGTLSFSKEMEQVAVENLQAGDVFIQGGSPGHAVLVVDVAVHPASGKKVFLLAQSYMPAQEIHVLKNFSEPDLSPWYDLDFDEILDTPEWAFSRKDLKRF